MDPLRVKICGITQSQQAQSIVEMGIRTLGFICVPESPRFIEVSQMSHIIQNLMRLHEGLVQTIGVFANAPFEAIANTIESSHISGIQLHGSESIQYCSSLKTQFSHLEVIKAFRVQNRDTLKLVEQYEPYVDTFLLDAFHPSALGGTGHTWDWTLLKTCDLKKPWLLAGGLTPDNIQRALSQCHPAGIDLSSGVELSPGQKDLQKVQDLVQKLKTTGYFGN